MSPIECEGTPTLGPVGGGRRLGPGRDGPRGCSRGATFPRAPSRRARPLEPRRTGWSRAGAGVALLTLAFTACEPPARPAADPLAHWPASWRWSPDAEPVRAGAAMVVSTDAYASEVGLEVLRAGGNAVDAAVAVSFALAVVNPEAGNLGGGGFMVVRTGDGETAALDYRETAPAAATRDMFLDEQGSVTDRSLVGHLAAGVPGSVMGLWEAHRRFGSRPWEQLVQPAVELAEGFVVGERFLHSLTPTVIEGLGRFPASAETFLPGGAPPREGETFRQSDLARTLERIRDQGPDGFYRGETADLIVAEMGRGGGIITHQDLAGYRAVWREPIRFGYRGHTVLSMPPSSSGGATLAETAHLLEGFDVAALPWNGPEHVHLLAEAWRRAYVDRNAYMADPAFVDVPLETLTSPEYGAWRATDVSLEAATPSQAVEPGVEAYRARAAGAAGGAVAPAGASPEGESTTHISVVDAAGGAVSLTTTINSWYGSMVVVPGAGFLLNNEMDDFTSRPGVPNQFGLVQGEANAVEPGKRMLSAMSPTIVLDPEGRLLLVVGTPGGSTIITTVFQVLSNVIDHGMDIAPAVLAPRVHHQHLPDELQFEDGGLPDHVVARLRELGHTLVERGGVSGDVQAILVHPDGALEAMSDPRRGGVAVGY